MRTFRRTPHRDPTRGSALSFQPGQRWHSLSEPELGLGIVLAVEGREIVISYPVREVTRRYATDAAPLARARLGVGQPIRGAGVSFRVEEVVEADGLLTYRGNDQVLAEQDLDADLDVAMPENRLRTAQVDDHRAFDLRKDAISAQHRMLSSPARGFLGGRIRLFDHQLSIARDVCERHRVRVLLADEVGLGKTIEALLIVHRMLLAGRVERVLVIVPPALVHQWLAEAYHRFNLILRVIGRDTLGGGTIDPEGDDLPSELQSAQLFVCPLGVPGADAFIDAEWDLAIVDEAHHLEADSPELQLVERLAERVEHVVLLSATPDRDGEEPHFRRLQLLDPARFHDFEAYETESTHYRELADTAERLAGGDALSPADQERLRSRLASTDLDQLLADADNDPNARQTLLRRLLDLHGIGRVMFRNVRARIPGFPRRTPVPAVLASSNVDRLKREFLHDIGQDDSFRFVRAADDPRKLWLDEFLRDHPDEKVLVLCADRAKVEGFADALEQGHGDGKIEVARFHEDMSSIERDRQGAWFLADDGPQLLISAQIGAEGRNFQVAHNLVLLDLPLTADRLEQLIGRVDRIGQGEEIRVFVPSAPGTPQDRLRRWHTEALRVFLRPWHGSPVIDREFGEALLEALLAKDEAPIEALIKRGRKRNEQILAELEGGRDRLLELTSFDQQAATELREAIEVAEDGPELQRFMVEAFERADLELEDLGRRSFAVRPGPDYHRPFPGFHGQEMAVTFDRETGLEHPERTFLCWDHPMVRDTIDSLLAREVGNACIARLRGEITGLVMEALFVAEPTVARELRADRFFPPTPIRVVVDADGTPVTLDPDAAREVLRPLDRALLQNPHVNAKIPDLVEHARHAAEAQHEGVAQIAQERMLRELDPVVERLEELAMGNPEGSNPELDAVREERATLLEGLSQVRVRLDALRLIVVAPT